MNPGAEQTAAIRGTVVQRAERPLGTLGVIALAIAALVLAPLVAVIANAFGPGDVDLGAPRWDGAARVPREHARC